MRPGIPEQVHHAPQRLTQVNDDGQGPQDQRHNGHDLRHSGETLEIVQVEQPNDRRHRDAGKTDTDEVNDQRDIQTPCGALHAPQVAHARRHHSLVELDHKRNESDDHTDQGDPEKRQPTSGD